MKIIILMNIILFLLISCKEESYDIESYYTVPINKISRISRFGPFDYSLEYFIEVYNNYIIFRRNIDKQKLELKGTNCEIQFQTNYWNGESIKPGNIIIAENYSDYGYYIFWINEPVMKTKFHFDSDSIFNKMETYSNEIDETTDTLITSLEKDVINNLYPKFNGVYIHKIIDSITINYNYEITDVNNFYSSIKLHDLDIGKVYFINFCK